MLISGIEKVENAAPSPSPLIPTRPESLQLLRPEPGLLQTAHWAGFPAVYNKEHAVGFVRT